MHAIREWLTAAFHTVWGWVSSLWSDLMRGVMHDWPVAYFVLGMGILLVVGLIVIWYRGAR